MLKRLIVTILSAVMLLTFIPTISAAEKANSDSVITQDGEFVPLYTTSPDSSLKDHSNYMTKEQSVFFYTQTTFLALIAGYLIVFKVRCIPKGEKMHRRKTINKITDLGNKA